MDTLKTKEGRIIIRNLVFDTNEKMLRKLCEPYGRIAEVVLPTDPSTGKFKGFAFIQYSNKGEAQGAVYKLHKTMYKGREILVELSVDKRIYQPKEQPKQKEEEHEMEIEKEEQNDEMEIEEEEQNDEMEEEKNENEEEQEENEGQEAEEKTEKKSKQFDSEAMLPQTVFVQNIPYDIGENDFKAHFSQHGKLIYAKLVLNSSLKAKKEDGSQAHIGSGFVCFENEKLAKSLLSIYENVQKDPLKRPAFDPLNLTVMNGRNIIIKEALSRNAIKEAKGGADKSGLGIEKDKHGKRNLALLNEGRPVLESNIEGKNEKETEKRQRHWEETTQKVKNPNMKVSDVRITMISISKNLTIDEIKKIITDILEANMSHDDFIHKKKIKEVVFPEKENEQNNGIVFVEFDSREIASIFMKAVKDDETIQPLSNGKYDPIIEYAFYDFRVYQKKLKSIQKHENRVKKMERRKLLKEKKDVNRQKKKKNAQLKSVVMQMVDSSIKHNDLEKCNKAREMMKDLTSRGLKQRLGKKLDMKFGKIKTEEPEKLSKKIKKE